MPLVLRKRKGEVHERVESDILSLTCRTDYGVFQLPLKQLCVCVWCCVRVCGVLFCACVCVVLCVDVVCARVDLLTKNSHQKKKKKRKEKKTPFSHPPQHSYSSTSTGPRPRPQPLHPILNHRVPLLRGKVSLCICV